MTADRGSSPKEWLRAVEDFAGLWNRFSAVYLQGMSVEEVTEEKEDEFLRFEGSMMRQLGRVVEIENDRFDLRDQVVGVIHEAISLEALARQSDFQRNRLRQRWADTMQQIEKLYRFCESYDPRRARVSAISEVKRLNPFWDPTTGGFWETLTRALFAPGLFFEGMPIHKGSGKPVKFLFYVLLIPLLLLMLGWGLFHAGWVREVGENVTLESGILGETESFLAKFLILCVALLVILLLALIVSGILLALNAVGSVFMHVGVKLVGAKQTLRGTYRTMAYGAAPLLGVITAPAAIGYQVVGIHKVHKRPVALAILGWLLGAGIVFAVALAALGGALYATGNLLLGGEYVVVTTASASLSPNITPFRMEASAPRGAQLALVKKEQGFFFVEYLGKRYYLKEQDGEPSEFRWQGVPGLILSSTRMQVMRFMNRVNLLISKLQS